MNYKYTKETHFIVDPYSETAFDLFCLRFNNVILNQIHLEKKVILKYTKPQESFISELS